MKANLSVSISLASCLLISSATNTQSPSSCWHSCFSDSSAETFWISFSSFFSCPNSCTTFHSKALNESYSVCVHLFGHLPSDIFNRQHSKPLLLLDLLLFGQLCRNLLPFVEPFGLTAQLILQLPALLHFDSLSSRK